jgi:hypothetical protein
MWDGDGLPYHEPVETRGEEEPLCQDTRILIYLSRYINLLFCVRQPLYPGETSSDAPRKSAASHKINVIRPSGEVIHILRVWSLAVENKPLAAK